MAAEDGDLYIEMITDTEFQSRMYEHRLAPGGAQTMTEFGRKGGTDICLAITGWGEYRA